MLCATLCITMVLNSCRIHAEFMLISCWFHFHLNFHNALCNTLHINGVEFMSNSCWIHAEFKRNREKYLNLPIKWHLKHLTGLFMLYTIRNTVWDFSKNCYNCKKQLFFTELFEFSMNSAWIRHEFNTIVMQSVAQSIVKIKGENEISMKSAWIQHEFDMNSTPLLCKVLRKALWKFKVKMKSAWNQHEFSMNSTPIWFQLLYKALWKRVCTNHFQCIIICLFRI